jgi:hypothetical protein
LSTIYAPKEYYRRIATFLAEYKPPKLRIMKAFHFYHIPAFFRIMWVLGVIDRGRTHFWHLLISTLFRRPRLLAISVNLAVFGLHFRKVAEKVAASPVGADPSTDSVI